MRCRTALIFQLIFIILQGCQEHKIEKSLANQTEQSDPIEKPPNAQELFEIGQKHLEERELRKAWDALEQAAEIGHVRSQAIVGQLYLASGSGRESEDFAIAQATKWLEAANKSGDNEASYFLGTMHLDKKHKSPDTDLGIALVSKSANNGFAEAQFILAGYYKQGKFVPKNMDKAEDFYIRASDSNHEWALYFLAEFTERGELKKTPTSELNELYLRAAKLGNSLAQTSLGRRYGNGLGVPKSFETAYMWTTVCQGDNYLLFLII